MVSKQTPSPKRGAGRPRKDKHGIDSPPKPDRRVGAHESSAHVPMPPIHSSSEAHKALGVQQDPEHDTMRATLARAVLALKPGVPKGSLLPCREVERERIASHLQKGVMQGGTAQVLYVAGMPGTGKTAMVLDVLEHMKSVSSNFLTVHVNAMRLGTPEQIFREVAEQLFGKRVSSIDSRRLIKQYFSDCRQADPVVVLLIDEVDCLMTANQAVLYKVFDWLGIPKAKLVLAAISNTMDLPERLLPRVTSRFEINRVDFEPYKRDQLYEILRSRLKTSNALGAFNDVVLKLCAARIAAASGDVRKALQVCRRAAEMCLCTPHRDTEPVKLADFDAATSELLFANPVTQAILSLSSMAQRFLAALVLELREEECVDAVPLHKVWSRYLKLAAAAVNQCDRASTEPEVAGNDMADINDGHDIENGMYLVQRLEAMAILAKQASFVEFQTRMVSLASMETEDLACVLLKAEEDMTIRELLETAKWHTHSPSCTSLEH
jgi:Cdc6-like AAA superfamily ATPase